MSGESGGGIEDGTSVCERGSRDGRNAAPERAFLEHGVSQLGKRR